MSENETSSPEKTARARKAGASPRKKERLTPLEPQRGKKKPDKVFTRGGGHADPMPDKVLEEVTTVRAELLAPKGRCQVCNHPDCAGIEAAIMNTAVCDDIAVGDKGLRDVADKYGVPLSAIVSHRNSCMIRKMASELANSSQPSNRLAMESSATWINRLSYYLSKIDDQIERIEEKGREEGKWDERLMLSAVDEARKICTSNAELFIKVYQLRVDKKVQDDFIKIVMEEVDRVSPEIRDRIISRLTSRLALANAAGIS